MDSTILDLGEDLTGFLATLGQPIGQTAREMIVFELYRRSLVSSGKAAELLAIPRLDFIQRASESGIPYFRFTESEWQADESAHPAWPTLLIRNGPPPRVVLPVLPAVYRFSPPGGNRAGRPVAGRSRRNLDPLAKRRCRPTGGATSPQVSWSLVFLLERF